jgi:hypothetical protein
MLEIMFAMKVRRRYWPSATKAGAQHFDKSRRLLHRLARTIMEDYGSVGFVTGNCASSYSKGGDRNSWYPPERHRQGRLIDRVSGRRLRYR